MDLLNEPTGRGAQQAAAPMNGRWWRWWQLRQAFSDTLADPDFADTLPAMLFRGDEPPQAVQPATTRQQR